MTKSSTPHRTSWTAEEIGFLAGGPGRAAEAALARLMDGGLVRFSREGLVTAVHQNGYGATTALEAQILTGLTGAARPLGLVVGPAAHSHEMGALHRQLIDQALVHPRWKGPSVGKLVLRVLLIMLGVMFLGLGLVVEPALLAVTIVAWFVAILVRNRKMLTPTGRHVLGQARQNPRSRVDAVALHGLRGVVNGQRVADLYGLPRAVLFPAPVRHHRRRVSHSDSGGCGGFYEHHSCASSSSCSSSSCSSSSSSCSSSSCSSSSSSSCSSSSS